MSDYIYPNAVVYLIIVSYEIYVGSTVDMKGRMRGHRCVLGNPECRYKLYEKMRELELDFDSDDIEIIILEKYPCDDIPDLRRREGFFQRELEPTLTDRIEGRTRDEWFEDNAEYLKEYHTEYYKTNRVDLIERTKKWYRNNTERIKERHGRKTPCQYCNKEITIYHLKRHHTTCPNRPSSSS